MGRAAAGLVLCALLAACLVPAGARAAHPTGPAPPRLEAAAALLRTCETLACLRAVHAAAGPTRFNFPHFVVAGYHKSATTSLHAYLSGHPNVRSPLVKEPHFFSQRCRFRDCPPGVRAAQDERHYVAAVLGAAGAGPGVFHAAAAYEASASYAREGAAGLAARLAAELPWARVVLSLREPVSRALSWHAMLARDPNTAAADKCLARVGAAACVAADAATGGLLYAPDMEAWLAAFPRHQLFIAQYEELTGVGGPALLARLHAFLGLPPPGAPSVGGGANGSLPVANAGGRGRRGVEMARSEYAALVALVRPDAERLAATLARHGFVPSAASWLAAWEAVWEANLRDNCNDAGACHIQLS